MQLTGMLFCFSTNLTNYLREIFSFHIVCCIHSMLTYKGITTSIGLKIALGGLQTKFAMFLPSHIVDSDSIKVLRNLAQLTSTVVGALKKPRLHFTIIACRY